MRPISRRKPSILFALAAFTLSACTVEAGDEAAHAIAARFADESAPQLDHPAEVELIADSSVKPIEILNSTDVRARAEEENAIAAQAEARKAEEERRRAEIASREDARRAEEHLIAEERARAQNEAEEAEMLARARAEADARRIAEQKAAEEKRRAELAAREEARRAEERRRAQERKLAEAQRLAAEKAEAERRAKAQREADEAEMLARARAEAEERRLAKVREAKRLAEIATREQARKPAEARRVEEERRQAEEERFEAAEAKHLAEIAEQEKAGKVVSARATEFWRRFEAEQRQKAAEAKRRAEAARHEEERRAAEVRRAAALRQLEEESRRRAEQARAIAKLASAEEARKSVAAERDIRDPEAERRAAGLAEEPRTGQRDEAYPPPHALGGPSVGEFIGSGGPGITRVTVLLVMEPGKRGIRRFNKTADPILCVGAGCYISNGPGAPARVMRRAKAFGPVVAIGTRAGKCSRSLTCVFRSVDLERARSQIQPIDLRILRHDRREASTVMADRTCRTDGKRLTCSQTVVADSYRMWIVPESVAEQAGALALEFAVRAGLPSDNEMIEARRS